MSMQKRIVSLLLTFLMLLSSVSGILVSSASAAASLPVASGKAVEKNDKAIIDYSNTKDGYVMVQFSADSSKKLRAKLVGPKGGNGYTYTLTAKKWATLPLNEGNGSYKVTVYENTTANKYAPIVSTSFKVSLSDQFAPYLRPNQYVDYSSAPKTVAQAASLTSGVTDSLKKVEKIYNYVVKTLSYDKAKASSVQNDYLPVLDSVLAAKKGICFDYASLMAGMLRSQGIPCKLVIGYAGTQYHAWINVWTKETGWIENAIYFDGSNWQRMDPTFASSSNQSEAIMKYIGDGANYKEKFTY